MCESNSIIFAPGGEIDHHNAVKYRQELDGMIMNERPVKLTFDFSNVTFMDSSGIGLVLGRYRVMSAIGGKVEIIGASTSIKRIFKMSGADKIIEIN